MLSTQEVTITLRARGFNAQPGLKVVRLDHPRLDTPVFIKQSASLNSRAQAPLVLHPKYEEQMEEWGLIAGLERGQARYYHNSNLRGFPKRRNGGSSDIAYGVDVGFYSAAALEQLLDRLLHEPVAGMQPVAFSETPAVPSPEFVASTATERDALIKARIGQGDYRNALIAYWGGCAITGCVVPEILRASHIKPWREACPSERLDPYNGLLLTPNLDLTFDQGLISFDDNGRILLSEDLDPDSAAALHIHNDLRLRQIEPAHRVYLAWHREHLFRK